MNGDAGAAPTVAIIAEHRHLGNAALRRVRARLAERGCRVSLVVPGEDRLYAIPGARPAWDIALSRGRDLAGLGLLAAADALGVRTINRRAAIELVRNKVAMQAVLLEQGVPMPRTWFAAHADVFRAVPRSAFPLVVKPFDGDGARGLALLTRLEDVDRLPLEEGTRQLYLAQEFLVTDGWDLKLYGIGSRVWAVRKPSPVRFEGPGLASIVPTDGAETVDVNPELRDLALTSGRACGLELWGVDVALTPDGPRVIEVNDFPTYSAVPDAGDLIADHVLALAELDRLARAAGRDRLRSLVRGV